MAPTTICPLVGQLTVIFVNNSVSSAAWKRHPCIPVTSERQSLAFRSKSKTASTNSLSFPLCLRGFSINKLRNVFLGFPFRRIEIVGYTISAPLKGWFSPKFKATSYAAVLLIYGRNMDAELLFMYVPDVIKPRR